MGYSGARFEDGFETKVEELSADIFLEQQEIKSALSGRDFCIIGDDGDDVQLPGISPEDFWNLYYSLWEDFHDFGILPNGGGTKDESRLTLTIIRIGLRAWDEAQNWKRANPIRAGIKR